MSVFKRGPHKVISWTGLKPKSTGGKRPPAAKR
jgi:hypothetical protein